MMSGAGMPGGKHMLFGNDVIVGGSSARLADSTLAGSIITMDAAIRNTVRWGAVTAAQAISMATEVPARLLGLRDMGRLAPGISADVVLLDDALEVVSTHVRGERVFGEELCSPPTTATP
jgi:N-acetylglucosamine-6-phosphate deacetylase